MPCEKRTKIKKRLGLAHFFKKRVEINAVGVLTVKSQVIKKVGLEKFSYKG